MKENEVLKKQAIEDAERRIETQYEDRMSELTALQSRLAGVKSELQELHMENQASKQREEQARSATAKAMAHQASTRAEAESLARRQRRPRGLVRRRGGARCAGGEVTNASESITRNDKKNSHQAVRCSSRASRARARGTWSWRWCGPGARR